MRTLAISALLLVATVQSTGAQTAIESSKLNAGGVLQGAAQQGSKLNAGIVLQNTAIKAPKIVAYAILQSVPSRSLVLRAPLTHW